jgi:hypothetical protein
VAQDAFRRPPGSCCCPSSSAPLRCRWAGQGGAQPTGALPRGRANIAWARLRRAGGRPNQAFGGVADDRARHCAGPAAGQQARVQAGQAASWSTVWLQALTSVGHHFDPAPDEPVPEGRSPARAARLSAVPRSRPPPYRRGYGKVGRGHCGANAGRTGSANGPKRSAAREEYRLAPEDATGPGLSAEVIAELTNFITQLKETP